MGAYLTQNTGWTNVEKALANLRKARSLTVSGIRRSSLAELERLIRPAGYFRQKAKRLKLFVAFLDQQYQGSLTKLFAQPTKQLREELLNLHGVGPETADSILLYAGNHPVFVVDAYTRRILARHEILPEETAYDEIRELFERALEPVADSVAHSPAPCQSKCGGGISRRFASSVSDEHGEAHNSGAGLQRDAWPYRWSWKKLLQKITGPM